MACPLRLVVCKIWFYLLAGEKGELYLFEVKRRSVLKKLKDVWTAVELHKDFVQPLKS